MTGRATKYLSYSPDFRRGDHSGLISRLASGLAHYSNHGDVSCAVLRGGAPVRAQSMNLVMNALPTKGTVFVPRHVVLLDSPAAFPVTVAAANGESSLVVSDLLEVDAVNSTANVYGYAGAECLTGIMTALRILLNIYEVSNAGMVAGVSVTKGLHMVSTVVTHTDKGGNVRDMWRCLRFCPP